MPIGHDLVSINGACQDVENGRMIAPEDQRPTPVPVAGQPTPTPLAPPSVTGGGTCRAK